MTITVHPTLDVMAVIYSLSRDGGAESVRFRSYVDLAGSGHRVHAYNPMTGDPATLETVQRLRELDAEGITRHTLDEFEGLDELETAVVVLTPGFWTDRLFNEVRNRRDGLGAIWFWSGEEIDGELIDTRAKAEAVRTIWRRAHGVSENLRVFAGQEATVLNATGFEPAHADEATTLALEILGDENDDHALISFLVGDERAAEADWRGIGLAEDEGPRTVARWLAEKTTWPDALRNGWTP
jgi:hypothetical protein